MPSSPLPGTALKPSHSAKTIPRSPAHVTIALPRGCSLPFSTEAAASKSSASVNPSPAIMSVTSGTPSVSVPVLSSAITAVLPVCSRAAAVLNSIPDFAATPEPTIIATGVARPSAHGQDTTSTAMPLVTAVPTGAPEASQITATIEAIINTAGTKTAATLSAILAMGALVPAASATVCIILASAVSSPTAVARHLMNPDVFIVAADTLSPGSLSTGTDSPVRADSSTALAPSVTTPSTGIFSPGRTSIMSPASTSDMSTVTEAPSLTTTAVSGASLIKALRASVVFPFEIDSRSLPTVIRVTIMAADSK